MEFGKYVFTMIILVAIGALYNRYKVKVGDSEELDHYDIVKKYLLNDSSLANSKKPLLWVHIDYDVNARWWPSFGSRNTKCLNQPYLYLTLKSIVNKCGSSFNICLIDDESFKKILPGWNVDLSKIANPLREHYRNLALMKILYNYGGLLVPDSFLCFSNLDNLYTTCLETDKPIVGEFVDRNSTSLQKQFFPNPRLIGCKKECGVMEEFINYLEILNSTDNTNEMDFLGQPSRWCYKMILENKMSLICGRKLGVKNSKNKPVVLEELMGNTYIDLGDEAQGIYIPTDELLERTKYGWFVRMSPEQILESETTIGKYILINDHESL